MKTYEVVVTRGERFWLVDVPDIGYTTQARHLREVEEMAVDLVAGVTEAAPDSIEVSVSIITPENAAARLKRAQELRESSRQAQSDAAAEVREAAKALRADGIPLRDIGILLGVSYQRAGQLVGG